MIWDELLKQDNCKAVIFDLDGTLFDSMSIWRHAGARYLAALGIEAEPDLDDIVFPMTLMESSSYMKEHYHLRKSVEEVMADLQASVWDFYERQVRLKPGVLDLLQHLADAQIPMVIATTNERVHLTAALRRLGIHSYFSMVFTCTELMTSKHEPKIYQTAADYLQLTPSQIWVFEDVRYALETAHHAGFHTVAVYDEVSDALQKPLCAQDPCVDFYVKSFLSV